VRSGIDDAGPRGKVAAGGQKAKESGWCVPYLRSFVLARINPSRWIKGDAPNFKDVLKAMLERVAKFKVDTITHREFAGCGPA
jgi:ParB family chromosome partitioning protein